LFNVIHANTLNAPPYLGFSGDTDQRRTELLRRKEIVQNFVKDLGRQAGVDSAKIDMLEVIPSEESFGFTEGEATFRNGHDVMILAPHCYLDLVKDFQIHTLEELDEKLKDPEWTKEVIQVVAEVMGHVFLEPTNALLEAFKPIFRLNVSYLLNDPEKAFNSDRSTILHEYGHIQNEDTSRCNIKSLFQFLGTFLFAMLVTFISLLFFDPILDLVISNMTTSSLVTLAISLVVSMVATLFFVTNFVQKRKEVEADSFAASALPGIEGEKVRQGAIYFFESIPRDEETCFSFFKRILTDPHPTDQERIEKFKHFEPAISK